MEKSISVLSLRPSDLRGRRQARKNYILRIFFVLLAGLTSLGGFHLRDNIHGCRKSYWSIEKRVEHILRSTPLIDGHNDLPGKIRDLFGNMIYNSNFTFDTSLPGQVDLPRLKKGRVGGTFWSVFVPCPDTKETDDEVYYLIVQATLQQIDLVHRLAGVYPDLALTSSPLAVRHVHYHGKIASVMGAEGLHQIGNSASNLRLYHSLGVRYVTLTHNCNNKYADSALPANDTLWGGLSDDGKDIVKEMNRLGMIVDLSHTSHDTQMDTFKVTGAPVIYSHSSAYALCDHPRNVKDEALEKVKENNGVVMVNFYPMFVKRDGGEARLGDVADHVEYIGKKIGWEHVGIGSDFDGIGMVPVGLEDVSKFPKLLEELLRRGVTDRQASLIAGENILRVWRDVEKVSRKMNREGVKPLEDRVHESSHL
ncbi:membrane dipeptidase-domain-containing protein [Tuber borchii]|uniref:Dipeptidase n=1 Tax=Tuber borchii TaxID=42251 RepID=A0A2T6ZSR5_TUBBO|nr:membrane dipeptidase-domain-containing protein [Tuber borchii]